MDGWMDGGKSDAFRLSLNGDFRRTIIWRERVTRLHPTNIGGICPFGEGGDGVGVLVWAGILFDGHTDLHIFECSEVQRRDTGTQGRNVGDV